MGWRDAWRLSRTPLAEVSFQAIYAFRQGNLAPPGPARELAARARRRTLQSKVLVGFVLALITMGTALLLRSGPAGSTTLASYNLTPSAYDAGVLTGLFSLDVALLWWTGLQVLPTFLGSGALPVLETLPIDDTTLRRTAGIIYLRLFDIPVGIVLVATPLFVGVALGPLAGLATLPGAFTAVAFALALSFVTGRFFVRKIQGSRGGGGRTVVRWAHLLLWLIPAVAVLGFVSAGPVFFTVLSRAASSGPTTLFEGFEAAYPFPLALLPALTAQGTTGLSLAPMELLELAVAASGYTLLAVYAIVWLLGSVRWVARLPVSETRAGPVPAYSLKPQRPMWAILTKDLRTASRTPGYAFLILLPILDSVGIGLVTLADAPNHAAAQGLGLAAVVAAALLATFFGPAFFSIEVLAYSYSRALPLSNRSVIVGKAALIVSIYLIAGLMVLAIALVRVADPLVFLGFIAAELPAVVAAALLQLGILFRWARARGVPVPNLYAGAWNAIAVAVPGLVVASVPLLLYGRFGFVAMALVALGELAVCAPLVLGRRES
jgi:predicted permease